MASSSSASPPSTVMAERPSIETGGDHRLHQQPHPQCPRCNSSNTKFCYYNNYSLSQPRHFCKACKRYWTRGGTLRNVPVGGGCRKNKRRLKRPAPPPAGSQSAPSKPEMNNLSPPCSDRATNNPLIYGLPASNNPPEPLRFPSSSLCSGLDFLPEMSGFGLGFSSLLVNGPSFGSGPPPLSSSAGNMSVLFGSSASGSSSTMASLLSSTFQPQKLDTTSHFKDLIIEAANGASSSMTHLHHHHHHDKDVSIEEDPSSLLWSTNNLGSWFGPSKSNMGSSLSFLI